MWGNADLGCRSLLCRWSPSEQAVRAAVERLLGPAALGLLMWKPTVLKGSLSLLLICLQGFTAFQREGIGKRRDPTEVERTQISNVFCSILLQRIVFGGERGDYLCEPGAPICVPQGPCGVQSRCWGPPNARPGSSHVGTGSNQKRKG